MALLAGLVGGKVACKAFLVSASLTVMTSQHWVLAQEGDQRMASSIFSNLSDSTSLSKNLLILLLPEMASRTSIAGSFLWSKLKQKDLLFFSLYRIKRQQKGSQKHYSGKPLGMALIQVHGSKKFLCVKSRTYKEWASEGP
jgi:hypothetical protein